MSLQYLKTLESIGMSPATKVVLPAELTTMLRPFVDHAVRASSDGRARADDDRPSRVSTPS